MLRHLPCASRRAALLALAASALLTGCLSPGPPLEVRSFEPAAEARLEPTGTPHRLLLGSVTARAHLDVPMAWRVSGVELKFEQGERWSAPPARLVEDRLRALLYGDGAFVPSPGKTSRRLELVLERFEGRAGDLPRAEVALRASLMDADQAVEIQRFEASEALEGSRGVDLAHGLGSALDRCVLQLAAWLRERTEP